MKFKYFFLILVLLISFNNTYAFTYKNTSSVESCWDNLTCNQIITNGTNNNLTLISYNETPLNGDLRSQWNFNNNASDFSDSSVNENTGTNFGTTGISGYYGIGRFFDGTSFINHSDSNSLDIVGGFITIVGLIYPTSLTGTHHLVFKGVATAGTQPHNYEFLLSGDKLSFTFLSGGANRGHTDTSCSININQWNLVSVSMNDSNVLFYHNNVLCDTPIRTQNLESDIGNLYVGSEITSTKFEGIIDEIKIFNRSLSLTEISNLFNNSFSISGNITTNNLGMNNNTFKGNFLTLPNGSSFNLYYNGTGNFINICTNCLNDTFYNFDNSIGGEIRIELISNGVVTPNLLNFEVLERLKIINLIPVNDTTVNLNGTIFDQEFNLTVVGGEGTETNATLLVWNKTTSEPFDYFVKEFVDDIENIFGNTFTGDIDSLKSSFDGDILIITENSGANSLDFRFNFTNVDRQYNNYTVHMLTAFSGTPPHENNVSIFNFTSNTWLNLFSIPALEMVEFLSSIELNTNDIIDENNRTSLRIEHIENGNPAHELLIDHIGLHSENNTKKVIINLQNNTNTGVTISLPEGIFLWNYLVVNNINQSTTNESNLTFTVNADITEPNLIFIDPTPDNNSIIIDQDFTIKVLSDEALRNITLNLSDGRIFEMIRIPPFVFELNFSDISLLNINYSYNVTGTDVVGNINFTETRNFIINIPEFINITGTSNIIEIEETDTSDLFYLILLLFIIFFMFSIAINKNSSIISITNGFIIIISTAIIKLTTFTFITRKYISVINNINVGINNISVYNNTIFKFITIHTFVVPDKYIIILLIMGVYTIMRGSVLREDVKEK